MNALPERVPLATDGSEDARCATRAAVELQARSGVEPHVARVWRDVPTPYARASIKRELSPRGRRHWTRSWR